MNIYKHIYFIGIGGAGMSALASYFLQTQPMVSVYGYDKVSSDNAERLASLGANISFDLEQSIEYIKTFSTKNTLVVYTPAISKHHKLFQTGLNNNYTMLKRSEVLGKISENYYTIAIAGTHGKTTVTSMLTMLLKAINAPIISFVGGVVLGINSNFYAVNKPKFMVVEADEFDRSFLHLKPDVVILTSIDSDHLDIYKSHSAVKQAFFQFISQIKTRGMLITSQKVLSELEVDKKVEIKTYGSQKASDYVLGTCSHKNNKQQFCIEHAGKKLKTFSMNTFGRHNAENMLSAIITTHTVFNFDIESEKLHLAVGSYKGVKRRFEYYLNTSNKVYIDDYAHHPEEINTVINSVKEIYSNRKITVVFQPHLYTRTKDFYRAFAKALSTVYRLILLPIYPAREEPIEGVNTSLIYNENKAKERFMFSKTSCLEYIKNNNSKIDILLTFGAGDIGLLTHQIKQCLIQ